MMIVFVNYKTYEQGTGQRAVALTKIIEGVLKQTRNKVVPVVQAVDVGQVVSSSSLEIWVQGVTGVGFGAHTGAVLPEAVVESGASGTFLNHSESKLNNLEELERVEKRAREAGLKTLVFAKDIGEFKRVLELKPNFAAYEPPELVGNKEISVASAKPEVISQASALAKNAGIPLIVGAGIHSLEDVKKSLKLGASGVAIASNIMLSQDPGKELLNLTEGIE